MSRVDAGVLLTHGVRIARLKGDFRANRARPGAVAYEHRPSRSARHGGRPAQFGDELGADDDVTKSRPSRGTVCMIG